MKYADALIIANDVKTILEPFAHRIEIAGSVRRKKQIDIKDVEIVMIPKPEKMIIFKSEIEKLPVTKGKFPGRYIQFYYAGEKIDLFITSVECWGCIFMIRTGSAEFSKRMMIRAKNQGMHFRDGRLRLVGGAPLYTAEERDVFRLLEMKFVKPEDRL